MRLVTTGGRLITSDWSTSSLDYKQVNSRLQTFLLRQSLQLVVALRAQRPDARADGTPPDGLKSGLTMCIEVKKQHLFY